MRDVGGRRPDPAGNFLLSQLAPTSAFANNPPEGMFLAPCHLNNDSGQVVYATNYQRSVRVYQLSELCALVLADYQKKGQRSADRIRVAFDDKRLGGFFRLDKRAMDLTSADVDPYIEYRKVQGMRPATINLNSQQ